MNAPSEWTPENVETMMRMIRVEGASMREVGAVLGRSRNSIIGKYHRICKSRGLGLQPRTLTAKEFSTDISDELSRSTVPKRKYTRRRPGVFKNGVGFILKGVVLPEPSKDGAVGILYVTGCRWPVGTDPAIAGTHVFCNAAVNGPGSYCQYHFHMSQPVSVPKMGVKRFVIPTSLLRAGAA